MATSFNFDLKNKTKSIKKNVKSINEATLSLTEDIVEGTIETGAKWQKVLAKALKSGVVLFGKQQEMALDAIEELKGQYKFGAKRMKKLVSLTPEMKKVVERVDLPTVKSVQTTMNKAAKTVRSNVADATKSVEFTVKSKKAIATKKVKATKKATAKKVQRKAAIADDLTLIDGIDNRMAERLVDAGFKTYKQLVNARLGDLRAVVKSAGPNYSNVSPTPWRKEAKAILASK